MPNLKLAIVGAGYIAREHLKSINKLSGLSPELIYSRTFNKSQKLADEFGIPTIAKSYEEFILNLKGIDGILILVSPEKMFEVTDLLIPYQIPLFIEKPPALSYEEILQLNTKASVNKTLNMVGFNRRFYSIYHKGIKKIRDHGRLLGLSIEGHERFWKLGDSFTKNTKDSWLYANSSHTIDLIDFFGGELDELKVFSSSLNQTHGDQFVASMRFKSGTLGTYTSHWYSPGGWSVTLYGEEITVIFKPLEKGVWIDRDFKEHEIKPSKSDLLLKEGFYEQMKSFRNLINTKNVEWPAVSLEGSLRTVNSINSFFID